MIGTFLEQLSIPKSCELNKPVYKKDFLENGILDVTDKKVLKEDVDKIRWLYTLKSSTINISAYSDDEKDYPEVAIIHVELLSPSRVKRIASFMQRSIPYPLVLLFSFETTLCISLAEKRINQSDKEKWVVEDSYNTDWLNLEQPTDQQADFLVDCNISKFSFSNFLAFYKSILDRVIALNCAAYTGVYELNKPEISDRAEGERNSNRVTDLRELENLNSVKAEIATRLIKEKQMGKQVEMNVQIKQIDDQIARIKENI